MKYMGSKTRIAKYILPIILQGRKQEQYYVEPFVGGCNTIDKVDGNRIGNDNHYYLIQFLQAVQNGYNPPKEVSEELYKQVQINKTQYSEALVGYIGFYLSYGGKWFGGYRRDSSGKRNYSDEAYKNFIKQKPGVMGIQFTNMDYRDLQVPANSIIYCDPPYKGTTRYSNKDEFDTERFFTWCRIKKEEGHSVYVSEYEAPEDFTELWAVEICSTLVKDTGNKKAVEKLFKL